VSADRPVVLVGLSGTGKSSVAPRLAERLGLAVADLDARIAGAAGCTVAEYFSRHGEAAFRRRELAELEAVLAGPPAVVATGGGLVTIPEARARLSSACTVVWLRAEPEVLAERLAGTGEERPLLAGDAATTLRRLATEREALYREVADVVVDAGAPSAEEVTELIVSELAGAGRP
jgi:shikimate kinase